MKMAVFWVVAPCSLVEVCRRFSGACCLHYRGDGSEVLAASIIRAMIALIMQAASTSKTSVNLYQTDYTAQQPR
jgi:hypothetical protein